MMVPRRRMPDPTKWLPLAPLTTEALMSLAAGKCHGSLIADDIRERTGGAFHFTVGTVYSVLHRLDLDELIVETTPCSDASGRQGNRRCYALTPLGREVMRLEIDRLERTVAAARSRGLVGPAGHG